jgi:chemotaxis response regulator CheB
MSDTSNDIPLNIESNATLSDSVVEIESKALEWARTQANEPRQAPSASRSTNNDTAQSKKFVVVGAGWGGWGAAKALCQSNVDAEVILIDTLPDPTGNTPYLSKSGKPVEAGTRGFWKE